MLLTRAKFATAAFLAVTLIAAAGALACQALSAREAPPSAQQAGLGQPAAAARTGEADTIEVSGRVLDPEGQPFAGAKLSMRSSNPKEQDRPLRATSGADGRFSFTFKRSILDHSSPHSSWFGVIAVAEGYGPDWTYQGEPAQRIELTLRLVKDVPIQGRVLDLEGKPVKGATFQVLHIEAYTNTDAFLQTVRNRESPELHSKGWSGPFPGQPKTLTTDADGRFRLAGVGRDRLVQFHLEGPGIAYGPVRALARELKAPVEPGRQKTPYGPVIETVYGATFTFTSVPSRLIRGVVRDKKTGRPVAGIQVSAWGTTRDTSDKEGRYELRGHPKREGGYRVDFAPAGHLYFFRSVLFPDTPGLGPIQGDIELVGGILVTGRVTHQVTGKPIAGAKVHYNPLLPNPFVRLFPASEAIAGPRSSADTGSDGSYRLVVLPGPGVLGFSARSPKETFMPALVTTQELKDFFKDNGDHGNENRLRVQTSETSFTAMGQEQYNQMLLINPGEKDEALIRDVVLQPARQLRGKVVGPDGKAFAGVRAYHLSTPFVSGILSEPLAADTFTVTGLNPRRPRHLLFIDQDRKYGEFLTLVGEVKEPLIVRLQPCGSVASRLLDSDGQPMAGATVRLDPEAVYSSEPAKVQTDRAGRFRITGLVPGQKYQARLGPPPLGQYLSTPFAVKPQESKDLGDIRVKPVQ
jgi:protocatechuate 3,4-dioxygenase beta subunit